MPGQIAQQSHAMIKTNVPNRTNAVPAGIYTYKYVVNTGIYVLEAGYSPPSPLQTMLVVTEIMACHADCKHCEVNIA